MPSIEEHIRRALEEGKFKDLPGKGKPLRLPDQTHTDPEWRAAHNMLKSSGYTLPWIETRQEIEQSIDAARDDLRRAWEWRQQAAGRKAVLSQADAEWQRAVRAFAEKLASINKNIITYNLEAPSSQFHLQLIKLEKELARVQGENPAG